MNLANPVIPPKLVLVFIQVQINVIPYMLDHGHTYRSFNTFLGS